MYTWLTQVLRRWRYDGEGDKEMGAWKEAMERWSAVSFIHVLSIMQGEDPEK